MMKSGRIKKYVIKYRGESYTIRTRNDHIAKSLKLNQPYESMFLFDLIARKYSGEFWDVGAHVGNHSIFLAMFGDFERIVSIEADPDHYNLLVSNMIENKLNTIDPVNMAAWDCIDFVDIIREGPNDGSYRVRKGEAQKAGTIDNLADLYKPKKISAIKFDIEGSELKALRGAKKTLKKFKPVLFIELNENADKVKSFLYSQGYDQKKVFRMGSPLGEFRKM